MDSQEIYAKLKEKFGEVKRATGGQLRIPCPTCSAEHAKKCKRYIYPNSFYTKCWICGESLTLADLLGDDVQYDRAVGLGPEPEHPQSRVAPCRGFIPINQLPGDHPAIRFLTKDHLHDLDRYWEKYRVCYIPLQMGDDVIFDKGEGIPPTKVRTGDCILFPVVFNQEVVGWQLRFVPGTFWGDKSKMKYFHVFQKGRYLFNFDEAVQHDHVVVMEGIKKALKIPNAVATLGKNITDDQANLLFRWPKITLMLDGDDKTQSLAEPLRDKLETIAKNIPTRMFGIAPEDRRVVNVGLKKYGFPSPDEMTTEQVNAVLQDAWK